MSGGGPPSAVGNASLRSNTQRCPALRLEKRKGPAPTGAVSNRLCRHSDGGMFANWAAGRIGSSQRTSGKSGGAVR